MYAGLAKKTNPAGMPACLCCCFRQRPAADTQGSAGNGLDYVDNPLARKKRSVKDGVAPLKASLSKNNSAQDYMSIIDQIRDNPRLRRQVIEALVEDGHLLHQGEAVAPNKPSKPNKPNRQTSYQKIRGSYTWLQSDLTKKVQKVQRMESQYQMKEKLESKLNKVEGMRRERKKSTSRQDYEQVLEDIIGPEPAAEQDWREDWESLTKGYSGSVEKVRSLEQWLEWQAPLLRRIINRGFDGEEAQIIASLLSRPIAMGIQDVLGSSVKNATPPEQSHASLIYKGTTLLSREASATGGHTSTGRSIVPMSCFRHLTGKGVGLADLDQRMSELEQPDSTGFYGLTTYTPLMVRIYRTVCALH
jgi:hypothetical protein